MKKLISALLFGLGALILTSNALGQELGIGVVDFQQILQTSPQVKKIRLALTQKFEERRKKLEEQTQSLQMKLKDLEKNRAVMGKEKISSTKQEIDRESKQLRQDQMTFQQDVYEAQNEALDSFMSKIKNIVKDIAAQDKLQVILAKSAVLYVKDEHDITKEVVDKLG